MKSVKSFEYRREIQLGKVSEHLRYLATFD